MMTDIKPNLKIKLASPAEFNTAWDAFKSMGYESKKTPNHVPMFIYAYHTGSLVVDYATTPESNGEVSADEHFEHHVNRQVTLPELLEISQNHLEAKEARHQDLLLRELPLFEQHITRMGGHLQFIQWDHEQDCYQLNWSAIQAANQGSNQPEDDLKEVHASYAAFMTSNFYIWLSCAEGKALPEGYYAVPMQPTEEMVENAKKEFQIDEEEYEEQYGESLDDHIVFAHQAMIQTLHGPQAQ